MTRLATPVEEMKEAYDVVVVGSGYGGAINASRLARAGRSVCVLERGSERQPGEYPETSAAGTREMQADLPNRRLGSRTALFDFRINPEISVLQGCGLGGTSLINANVAIEPDERVWADPVWPEALRRDVGEGIARGYERAREMLRPTPLPGSAAPAKTRALEDSASFMGERFERPPIAVNFEDRVNHVGVEQPACNSCGNCVSGCNVGAKNTLITNYLPDARNHGAHLFTRTSVRRVERQGDRWVVHFDLLESGLPRFAAPTMFVAADVVVLAAGTLGSTEILLRSREHGLPLSDRLGHAFTGNGDVLGFAYNADQPIHGVGVKHDSGREGPGPCITGVIDLRETERLEDGMIIEEGVIPSTLAPILATSMFLSARALGVDTDEGLKDYALEKYRELQGFVPGGSAGAVGNTQTFLVMAHDDASGRIRLEDDRTRISWPDVGSQAVFERINERLLEATRAVGGTYLKNPVWADRVGKGLVTVHPLGGCPMGDSAESGVVDDRGRVFAGRSGGEVHEGLYVSDGSVMPRSLGVNPFLTISALAERTAALIAEEAGDELSYTLPSRPPEPAAAGSVGIEFTQRMRGFVSLATGGEPAGEADSDFEEAARRGEEAGTELSFTVTVRAGSLEAMLQDPRHEAGLFGTVSCPTLSPDPLRVVEGTFRLLTEDAGVVDGRRMTYRMRLQAADGECWRFHGVKHIHDDAGFDLWSDTTTLYVTLTREDEGEAADEPAVARGVLRMTARDVARQLRTLQVTGADGVGERLRATARFGRFFVGSLYDVYGGVLAPRSGMDPDAAPRVRRELRVAPPEVHFLEADDGVPLRLVRYPQKEREPVLLLHGLGTSGTAFALDTLDTSLVEYLAEAGREPWVLDCRASIDLDSSEEAFTADDVARQDLPAALDRLLEETGRESVDVVAHGFGGLTLLMALLDGMEGVRSAVCSQAALHLVAPRGGRLKAGLHLPGVLKAMGSSAVRSAEAGSGGWKNRLVDTALRVLPVEAEEACSNPVCRRIIFMYGHLYEHDQLDRATHDALHEVFGPVGLEVFQHLAAMVRAGHLVDAEGESCLRELDRLALPLTFLHGAENGHLLPESSERTVELLADKNGPERYGRVVIPDYGDMDCLIGQHAHRDVYPHILDHLRAQSD